MRWIVRIVMLCLLGVGHWGFSLFGPPAAPRFSGQIESQDAFIGSRLGGRVETILKREGEWVKAKEVIVRFESSEARLRLQAAQASEAALAATLRKLKAGYQKEEIAVAQAEFLALSATYESARKNYERQQSLSLTHATTPKEREDAEGRYLEAKAHKEAGKKRLELLEKGVRSEEIAAAEAHLKRAEAERAVLEMELSEMEVTAPMEGRIEKLSVQPGDLVAKNQPIVRLSLPQERYAKFYVPETALHALKVGGSVEIAIDGSEERFKGEIFFISQSAEFTPKNSSTQEERAHLLFAIKARVESAVLKPGMHIEVSPL